MSTDSSKPCVEESSHSDQCKITKNQNLLVDHLVLAELQEHKIRHAMGIRDENYQLSGLVELDESFFGAPTEGGKRGRGTDKTPVMTGLSLDLQGRPPIRSHAGT